MQWFIFLNAYLHIHLKPLLRNSVKGRNKAAIGSLEALYFQFQICFSTWKVNFYNDSASSLSLEWEVNKPHLYQSDSCSQLPGACTEGVGMWRPMCQWGPKETTYPFLEQGHSRKSGECLFPTRMPFSYKNNDDSTKLSIPSPPDMVLNCNEPGSAPVEWRHSLVSLLETQPCHLTFSGACSVAGEIFFLFKYMTWSNKSESSFSREGWVGAFIHLYTYGHISLSTCCMPTRWHLLREYHSWPRE